MEAGHQPVDAPIHGEIGAQPGLAGGPQAGAQILMGDELAERGGEGVGIDLPEQGVAVEIGKGRVMRQGDKVAILSYGTRLKESMAAAEELNAMGLSTTRVSTSTPLLTMPGNMESAINMDMPPAECPTPIEPSRPSA